jgi:hypothetical protein
MQRAGRNRRGCCRPRLELLEDRTLPSSGPFTVTQAIDDGSGQAGTLSWAISQANLYANSEIDFKLGTGGRQSITVVWPLPAITQAGVYINGTSEPGTSPTSGPLVSLVGSEFLNGLDIRAAGCVINGLALTSFNNAVLLGGSNATGDLIEGCYFQNNSTGIYIGNGASLNTIGGTDSGAAAGNVFADNTGPGVELVEAVTTGTTISANAIFGNRAPGILPVYGGFATFTPTLNPLATPGVATGSLNGTRNSTYTVEFFANPDAASGNAEGRDYLGSENVTTDPLGKVSFRFTYGPLTAEPYITATATDSLGNTSEFSNAALAVGAPTHLVFGSPPTTTVVGGTLPPVTVLVEDAQSDIVTTDNSDVVKLGLGSNRTGASLGGTLSATVQNGIATFNNLSLSRAGTGYTLTASANGLAGAVSSAFAVSPTTHLSAAAPASATAGSSLLVVVTARDALGHADPSYRGTIHFTSSDPQAVLPAVYTFTAADEGTHLFSVTLKTAGSDAVRFTDLSKATVTGRLGVIVAPAGTSTLALNYPRLVLAGSSHTFTVTAEDAFGNLTPGYHGDVGFICSDPKVTGLPFHYTYRRTDAGVHIFSAAFVSPCLGLRVVSPCAARTVF